MAPAGRPTRFQYPVMKSLRHLVSPSGLMLPALRRSLWVHGDTAIEFLVARRLIQSIMDDRPHVSLVVTAPQADTVRFLGRMFPDEQALPMPQPAAMGRWLRSLQVRHLLLLDAGRSLSATAIQATSAQGIPISAVNIADPLAVAPALLAAARGMPSSVRLCVHDAVVASELLGRGIPSNVVVETGLLSCDRGMHAPGALLRQRLHLSNQVPIAAALDVPAAEEALVLDAFAEARSLRPDLRLLCETRDIRRAGDLQQQFESRGWTVATPSALAARCAEHWDVLLPSEPGEAASLLPIASVASIGGSYGVHPSGAVAALAATAGLRTLVGPCRGFTDVPWRILEHVPGMHSIDPCSLAREFAMAATGATAHPHVPAAGSESVRRTHDALAARMPESPPLPPVAQNWKIPTWRDRIGRSRLWGGAVPSADTRADRYLDRSRKTPAQSQERALPGQRSQFGRSATGVIRPRLSVPNQLAVEGAWVPRESAGRVRRGCRHDLSSGWGHVRNLGPLVGTGHAAAAPHHPGRGRHALFHNGADFPADS